MYILGINAFHGDSSACLLKDGIVICATEEERFTRIKHWAGLPLRSIRFCLSDANISIEDIDYIAISRDPYANLLKKILYLMKSRLLSSSILDRLLNLNKIKSIKSEIASSFNISTSSIRASFYNIEHHRSHLASSFFASNFNSSAILSIDGFGDFSSTMTAIGQGNKISVLDSISYPHSLGIFYTAVTQFLGFDNYGDEYKVMGLASYGNDKYFDHFFRMISVNRDGSFLLNPDFFNHMKHGVTMKWDDGSPFIERLFTLEWRKIFGKERMNHEDLNQHHFDIAASAQKFLEHIVTEILNDLYNKTDLDNICIAGGVGQNSVLNGKILRNTRFKEIYIPCASHDAGTSIGAALYLFNHILDYDRSPDIQDPYFGKQSTQQEIIDCLEDFSVKYEILNDDTLFERVSQKLVSGGVIGWFQGRAEFGPRALGNRSILMDPRRSDAKDLLNKKIKKRESFRPFAPSILEEYVSDYFLEKGRVPFMERVFSIRKDKRHLIPAVTHIDGTGRLQSVSKQSNPRYYRLIMNFYKKTNIPILLNTSFNENEPIVNIPSEAIDCFLRTNMDMLVMNNVVIERNTHE